MSSGIFQDVVAYRIVRANLRVDGTGERVIGAAVTGNFFQALGVQPHVGRTFIADEGTPERHPRVVVHVNVPISELFLPGLENRENANGLTVIARLRDGDIPQQAQMAVTRLGDELERRYPQANRGLSRQAAVFPLRELFVRGAPREMVLLPVIMLVLFGLILLIACGNVAGLLLARAATRRHEIAVRVALGAKRVRLVQALLAEAMVLGIISAAGGVLLTLGVIPILNAVTLPGQVPLHLSIAPDAWLVAYAVLMALVTTVTCGLVPALRGTRVNVARSFTRPDDAARRGFLLGNL